MIQMRVLCMFVFLIIVLIGCNEGEPTITGEVIDIDNERFLVESINDKEDLVWFSTKKMESIKIGQVVSVWTSAMAESYPAQAIAEKIKIIGQPSAYEKVNTLDGVSMSIKEGTVSPTGVTIILKNETNDEEWVYGIDYVLEKKINGKWYKVQDKHDGYYAFEAIGYLLQPEEITEQEVDWNWLYGSVEPGEYRLLKKLIDSIEGNYEEYYVKVEFIVE